MYDIRTRSPLRCAGRRVAAAVTVVAAATAVILPQQSASAETPLFEQIGELERFPADARALVGSDIVPTWKTVEEPVNAEWRARAGTGIIIPEVRQLWQIYYSKADTMAAVVRDLDSMQITRTLRLPFLVRRATSSSAHGGDWTHAVDLHHKRIFFVTDPKQAGNQEVMEVDLHDFSIVSRPLPTDGMVGISPNMPIGGLTYDRYEDALLLFYGGPANQSAANTNTFLYTLDVSGPPPPTGMSPAAAQNIRQIRSCTAPLTSTDVGGDTYNWEILVSERYLYIPCQRVGHTGIVVRTTRATAEDRTPAEEAAAGPVYVENAVADQAGGRIVMTTYLDKEIWTFEAATMSFVGIASTSPPGNLQARTGYGFDRETGRIFFQSPKFGLGVVEGRFFPLPQARSIDRQAEGQERILSDARTSRIFVLEGYAFNRPGSYRVYRTTAAPVPPPPADPDRNTVDVEEQPGVTESRFFANGSAYGTRVLLAKGLTAVPPAPVAGVQAPTAQHLEQTGNSKCGFTDRELVAGRVFKAEYDTGSAAASAIAVDVDGATKQDLDKPSRCDLHQKNGDTFQGVFGVQPVESAPTLDETTQHPDDPETDEQESRWTWQRASCSSSEGTGAQEAKGAADDFGPSAVSCPTPGGILTATAEAYLQGANVTVGKAWSNTKIGRRSGEGVAVAVESVAQDVRLALPNAPVVTFAEIRSRAASRSAGRPQKQAMSGHEVVIRGARVGGKTVCDQCEGQDLIPLVDALNEALAGRAQFRTGRGADSGLDPALVKGSAGGAQTAVQKSPARQASDRALIGDYTVEVPALEVTVFNDNTQWGRARQLYQFAGVASAATYNIVVQPSGTDFPPPDLGPFEGPFGGTGSTGSPIVQTIEHFDEVGNSSFGGSPVAAAFDDDDDDSDDNGGFFAPLRAVARGLRLFFTNPRHSLVLLTAWALLSLPAALSRRRRLLLEARTR